MRLPGGCWARYFEPGNGFYLSTWDYLLGESQPCPVTLNSQIRPSAIGASCCRVAFQGSSSGSSYYVGTSQYLQAPAHTYTSPTFVRDCLKTSPSFPLSKSLLLIGIPSEPIHALRSRAFRSQESPCCTSSQIYSSMVLFSRLV